MEPVTDNILGYNINSQEINIVIGEIVNGLASSNQKNFVCANPHSMVIAETDPDFKEAILNADLVIPDGTGIVLASKILGGSIRKRVTGSDVFSELSKSLNDQKGFRYYFLGSTEKTLNAIHRKLAIDYPNIIFAGSYSPPYNSSFTDADNWLMIEAINAAAPDVLWVGLTAPKQEKWIYQNRDQLNVNFIGPIGAVFDFYVGNVKRSHPIFQRMGLEWFPRLIQEPRRLFRRNFVSSPLFLWRVFGQWVKNQT